MAQSTTSIAARTAAAALLCVAGTASGAMPGLYFAGFYMDSSVGYATVDASRADFDAARVAVWSSYDFDVLSTDESSFDRTDIGYSVTLGYQFSEYLAAELAYVDMGAAKYKALGNVQPTGSGSAYLSGTWLSTKARGPALSAIVAWPLSDSWSLDARAGMLISKSKLKYTVALDTGEYDEGSLSGSSTALMFGAGINWAMSPGTAIRLGYSLLQEAAYRKSDITAWTLGLKYAW